MSPSSHSSTSAIRSDINVTPLVDVCLVLLIIFMVVMPIVQAGVKVDLPKTAKASGLPAEQTQIPVSIAEDGSVYVRTTRVAEADLVATLAAIYLAEPEHEVIVRGDRFRTATTAARMVAPVARPSSTTITDRPSTAGAGRPSR